MNLSWPDGHLGFERHRFDPAHLYPCPGREERRPFQIHRGGCPPRVLFSFPRVAVRPLVVYRRPICVFQQPAIRRCRSRRRKRESGARRHGCVGMTRYTEGQPSDVPANIEFPSSRSIPSADGRGTCYTPALLVPNGERPGLLHALPVCSVEHAYAAISGGTGLVCAPACQYSTPLSYQILQEFWRTMGWPALQEKAL